MQPFINFINKVYPIPPTILQTILEKFEPICFCKNDFLLKQGKICNQYIFLETGLVRAYTLDTEENEVTTGFFSSNSLVFEVASFFKRVPAMESLQAVTDCTGFVTSYDNVQFLFHSLPHFREFGRTILINGFVALKERTLFNINNTAEQRYEHLLITKPEIFKHVPLKQIASYLGITDTSLSRIRKEYSLK